MGELLYLYLEENNLLDEIANKLKVERNVQLMKKEKSDKDAYFEGSRYFDQKDFRKHICCYQYTYVVNTRFTMDDELVFCYLRNGKGISSEEEKPNDVFGNENTNMDYFNADGKEVVIYHKVDSDSGKEYISKHICYDGEARKKAFRLPATLKCLLSNEEEFATIICKMYNIDLHNYHSELLRREKLLNKIKVIDEQISRLEQLKNDYLNQLYYGETIKTR